MSKSTAAASAAATVAVFYGLMDSNHRKEVCALSLCVCVFMCRSISVFVCLCVYLSVYVCFSKYPSL